jgi:hypothetical protein
MKLEGSLPHSEQPVTSLYPYKDQSSPRAWHTSWRSISIYSYIPTIFKNVSVFRLDYVIFIVSFQT